MKKNIVLLLSYYASMAAQFLIFGKEMFKAVTYWIVWKNPYHFGRIDHVLFAIHLVAFAWYALFEYANRDREWKWKISLKIWKDV